MLVTAARRGVVLSCITLAARRDLWVLDDSEPHLAAPPHSGHATVKRGVMHWSTPLFPRHPNACEDSLENALILVARCQAHESALAIWESALNKGLVDPGVLERAPLPPDARRMLQQATPFADAGTESIFRTRLRWLRVPITPQAWILGHRVDFLIGDRLVIQIDGGHHVGAQRTSDIAHDALLTLHGYHVIRIGYEQLMDRWHEVQTRSWPRSRSACTSPRERRRSCAPPLTRTGGELSDRRRFRAQSSSDARVLLPSGERKSAATTPEPVPEVPKM
jgi:very-short-patch-repair endonuclease